MPLLESFSVDHTKMTAPAVRLAKRMVTPKGDPITVYDLRFCQPNKEIMSPDGIHTLEHLFAGFMRDNLYEQLIEIIDISPMGCRTGFYMSMVGERPEEMIAQAWEKSMQDILNVKTQAEIPELNIYQCGTCEMHSLEDAQKIAKNVLEKRVSVMKNQDLILDSSKIK